MTYDRYIDFFTYVLYHTANIDGNVAKEEQDLIKSLSGTQKLNEIIDFYNNHTEEERDIYFQAMRDTHLKDNDDKKAEILNKVREVIGADLEFEPEEKELYQNMKDLLYRW